MSTAPTHRRPLVPHATEAATRAILGGMKAVAEIGGGPSALDRQAIAGAARYIFGHAGEFDTGTLPALAPEALASALPPDLGEDAVRFLTVMTLVDGTLDKAKIAAVVRYAAALGVHERFLDDMISAARDRLDEALADMTRANMESITGKPWAGGDVNRWLVPYGEGHADPALAARFEALSALPSDSFGHSFWTHFRESGYAFPGEPVALNAAFSLPHDSAHVLTGYDTTPRGEILVSTFTASMHRIWPMAGHVLPVLLTWHVGVRLNDVAGDAHDALDPTEFWHAWAAGDAATVDTFAPDWDFWQYIEEPLVALRERWSIPVKGVEAAR